MSDKKKRESSPRGSETPRNSEADDSGMFRWYQDLLDRIIPKKKEGPED